MVRVFKDTVGDDIPHVWVRVIYNILFHTKESFFGFILSVMHGTEFLQGLFDGTVTVYTLGARILPLFTSSALVNFFGYFVR
jgi:hypothetical protein